jgi:hypothetical protein
MNGNPEIVESFCPADESFAISRPGGIARPSKAILKPKDVDHHLTHSKERMQC